jgi:outer membrane protein TolC
MGVDAGELPTLAPAPGLLEFTAPAPDAGRLLARAVEMRPELALAGARWEAAKTELTAARRERYPWLSFVQVTRRTGRLENLPGWSFQVGVELPVFRWRASALEGARAELVRRSLERSAAEKSIAAEVEELRLRMEAAAAELTGHQAEMQRLVRAHAELARAELAAGKSDLVETLLAGLREVAARQAYVEKLMEFRALEIGLEQAVGSAASLSTPRVLKAIP